MFFWTGKDLSKLLRPEKSPTGSFLLFHVPQLNLNIVVAWSLRPILVTRLHRYLHGLRRQPMRRFSGRIGSSEGVRHTRTTLRSA